MRQSGRGRTRPRSGCAPQTHMSSLFVEHLEERALLNRAPTGLPGLDALSIERKDWSPSRVLVRLKSGAACTDGELGKAQTLLPDLCQVTLAPGLSVERALGAYQQDQRVLGAQPDYRVQLAAARVPSDAMFGVQWALRNTGQNGGRAGADIRVTEAWAVTTGSPGTVVAVIDTGVDITHPDLAPNLWRNPGEVPANGIDDDKNGYIDDVHGFNFVLNNGDVFDDNGHGTHVAGTLGAVGNNGLGVAGIGWNVKIMALKFLDFFGSGYLSDAIKSLRYAVAHGATISNNSWGGNQSDPALSAAIEFARTKGHIFVTAAGNEAADNDITPFYPGNYRIDNIVAVAATDRHDNLASFSNYGATTVHLAAPGVNIFSTKPYDNYGYSSGTSMATPHVAGVLALVRGLHPEWTYRQVIDQVLRTVDPLPGLQGKTTTGGRLNAAAAVDNTGQVNSFLAGLYRDVMGRAADPVGLQFWVQVMREGASREEVADAFWRSAEHRGKQVEEYYRNFLGREADTQGRAIWVGAFLNGQDEMGVMRGFLTSAEYLARHGTTEQFVTGLYTDLLRRTPDTGGRTVWVQALQSGVPRSTVPPSFLTSVEMYRRLLNEYYGKFLGRAMDGNGEQAWMENLQSGRMTLGKVAVSILASHEYLVRNQQR